MIIEMYINKEPVFDTVLNMIDLNRCQCNPELDIQCYNCKNGNMAETIKNAFIISQSGYIYTGVIDKQLIISSPNHKLIEMKFNEEEISCGTYINCLLIMADILDITAISSKMIDFRTLVEIVHKSGVPISKLKAAIKNGNQDRFGLPKSTKPL